LIDVLSGNGVYVIRCNDMYKFGQPGILELDWHFFQTAKSIPKIVIRNHIHSDCRRLEVPCLEVVIV
jgi:hypothetical protein